MLRGLYVRVSWARKVVSSLSVAVRAIHQYWLTSSPAQVAYSAPACNAASCGCTESSWVIQSTASCWSAVRSPAGVWMASAMRPHSASWESSLAQVSAASWSLSGSWWSARVLATALSSSRRNAAAPSGPAAATAPGLSSPAGGGKTGHSWPDALIVQRSLISWPSNTGGSAFAGAASGDIGAKGSSAPTTSPTNHSEAAARPPLSSRSPVPDHASLTTPDVPRTSRMPR